MNDKNKSSLITIYGKDSNINTKNFDSIDEFQQYYDLHKDEIDKLSTVRLNRIYHINGYKITRRNLDNGKEDKTLCFRQLLKNELPKTNCDKYNVERFEEMDNKIKVLEIELSKIKQQVIEVVNVLNNSVD